MKNLFYGFYENTYQTKFLFKVIGSEVINKEVDAKKKWEEAKQETKIWTEEAQNALAGEIEKAKEKNTDVREVQKGDTIGAIVKGLIGNELDWGMKVEYRSKKLTKAQIKNFNEFSNWDLPESVASENATRPTIDLRECNLIVPGQFVWVEGGKVIIDDTATTPKPTATPANRRRGQPGPAR